MFDDVNMIRWMLGVLSLILMFGGLILILKRLQQSGKFNGTFNGAFNGLRPQGSLKIAETLQVDGRRKLILVEDGKEQHLILLGTTQELLVNSRPIDKDKIKGVTAPELNKAIKAS